MEWNDHERFKNRIVLRGKIRFETQVHVGSGESQVLGIENAVLKLRDGRPYIPASSIKGVLRSEVERVARARGLVVCDPLNPKAFPNCHNPDNKKEPCIVCGIFGSQKVAGHLIVQDALHSNSVVNLNFQPHVGIDRKSGVQHERAFYSFETVSPEALFDFEVIIENIGRDDERMGLLKYVFYEMKEGLIQLGGKKSAGLGMFRLVDCEVSERTQQKYTEMKKESLDAFLGDNYRE